MDDISQKISALVSDAMSAKQAELAGLLNKLQEDIAALQRAVGAFPGGSQPAETPSPAPAPRVTRRRRAKPERLAPVTQPVASAAPTKRKRREKTPEERAEISRRMTAYWQRRRDEKAAQQG